MADEIVGKITGVVFSNKTTGYYVLKVAIDGGGGQSAVAGVFPGTNFAIGLKASFLGSYVVHPTYGKQFSAQSCRLIPEKNRNGIISYLTSTVPSIGPVTAARLFDTLGDNLIELFEKDIETIRTLPFLTKSQCDTIISDWRSSNDQRNTSLYLSNLGLSSSQIKSAYTVFGTDVKSKIELNPYILTSVPGIGFSAADSVAVRFGINIDDSRRIDAIILAVISDIMLSEGHVYVRSNQIFDYVARRFFKKFTVEPFSHGEFLSESHFYASLSRLANTSLVTVDDNRIYLSEYYKKEQESSSIIAKMLTLDPHKFSSLDNFISTYSKNKNITFSDDQISALNLLNRSRVAVVSGFPGTGKTTLVSAFVQLFESHNLNVTLLSPTGIAAKRLAQVTGRSASTIHRALGCKKDGTWEFNASNKYHSDAIIVDEMSMVDLNIFHHLVSSINTNTILVLVGDSAQLPSVGSGLVLKSLLENDLVPKINLSKIFRQGRTSDIITIAHQILNDQKIDVSFNKDSEVIFIPYSTDEVMNEVMQLCSKLKTVNKNFQVIAPMYDGALGVNNLNSELRNILNPGTLTQKNATIKIGDSILVEGDRVMVVKNDYDRFIYNGDVGKILKIDLKNDSVDVKIFDWIDSTSSAVKYEEKVFTFKVEEARQMLRVAYACTTHKVQGQEFDYVIMPMTSQYGHMLYKNLIYTAITRASKKVFVLGDSNAFLHAVRNDREILRQTHMNPLISSFYDYHIVNVITKS